MKSFLVSLSKKGDESVPVSTTVVCFHTALILADVTKESVRGSQQLPAHHVFFTTIVDVVNVIGLL